jgi:hypothetical protein
MRQQIELYVAEVDLLFARNHAQIQDIIHGESDDYILNVGEEQYAKSLEDRFTLDVPIIHQTAVYGDSYEKEIPGSWFPATYHVDPLKNYKHEVIVYHVPYSGDIELLRLRPSPAALVQPTIIIDKEEQCILIEIIKFSHDPQSIAKSYQNSLRHILTNYGYLKGNIGSYNNRLNDFILSTLRNRKEQLLKRKSFLLALGVPIKKKLSTPDTFAIPKPKLREKIIVKPIVDSKGFQPEPTLDDHNYGRILKIINDVGKNFERLPSVYKGKEEEHLRDHILLTLDPNFEFGSATGETFNKSGKTDIQLRYDSSVVFIAECKFWRGEKKFIEGIDQLLNYLTWRDSKTAYILFVPNKDFTPVLDLTSELVSGHSNFVKESPKAAENWFNFTMNLPSDSNKEIKMTTLLYHIPKG